MYWITISLHSLPALLLNQVRQSVEATVVVVVVVATILLCRGSCSILVLCYYYYYFFFCGAVVVFFEWPSEKYNLLRLLIEEINFIILLNNFYLLEDRACAATPQSLFLTVVALLFSLSSE